MGGKHTASEDAKDWHEKNENIFLEILCEKVKKDPNGTPVFKSSDWQEIDDELFLVTGERYEMERLKGKYNRLRIKHRHFSELLDHTGVTYDSSSNVVFAAEDVWQMFNQKNKIFKVFKKNGCKNYEILGQIFNKSTATGHLHHASTQLPPTSDDERLNEEEFLNKGVHVQDGEKSKGKRAADDFLPDCVRVKKESKFEKIDSCLEMWASSLDARKERDLAKAERYKALCNNTTNISMDNYSIEACMDILETMENVSDGAYIKALEKLKDVDWRKMFIKMSNDRKKAWLNNLE
ncbi:uncharacterized protein LOC126683061 [Mercurialis annua]|uniref:uncharacterized protein LOC126683061 n=1 Tax=Mercurialis annua TaxID=3986 RepID=UPI00215ECBC3|nr:uncharacterized protein LOC126683061 [Mercurialis annua]